MKLENLKPAEGATKRGTRLGRGQGSGGGGTAKRGHKGAKSRSGYKTKKGFEGGQMPLYRRVPKFGFNNINRVEYKPINLDTLQALYENTNATDITLGVLKNNGLVAKSDRVKILGRGELSAKLNVAVHAFSKSAEEAITKAGGTVAIVNPGEEDFTAPEPVKKAKPKAKEEPKVKEESDTKAKAEAKAKKEAEAKAKKEADAKAEAEAKAKEEAAKAEADAKKEASAPKEEKAAPVKKTTAKKADGDDLKKIEGIGPAIAKLLNSHGVTTFAQLATTPADTVKEWLREAGSRFSFHNPTTWGEQAQLAADGKWDELKELQERLDGGRPETE